MPGADEGVLARSAAAGDGEAFAQLYEAYEQRIFNFCLRVVGSREDAADATQDAFLKVLQRLPKLPADRELNFGAYLFTAARNASYDVIGKRKKADPVDEIPEYGSAPVLGDSVGRLDESPERAAMLGSLQESVQEANARLPERQREVLAMRELEELSYDEIAEVMGMNRNSVAQLISRARINLRDELRGSALASVALATPDCERALPMIALRQDGQLKAEADRDWLAGHLASCDTCRVSVDAMEEAGVSYRAWAPVVPMAWLWKSTMAQAAELTGADWSELIARGRPGEGGSSGGGGGASGGAGGGAGAETDAAAGASSGARRRRRRSLAALLGAILLVPLFVTLVSGDDNVVESADTTPAATGAGAPTPTATTATVQVKTTKKSGKGKHASKTLVITTAAGETTTVPVDSPAAKRVLASLPPKERHQLVGSGGGSGSTGKGPTGPAPTVSVTAPVSGVGEVAPPAETTSDPAPTTTSETPPATTPPSTTPTSTTPTSTTPTSTSTTPTTSTPTTTKPTCTVRCSG